MAPVFQRIDRRFIATAVSAITHGDQDMFEEGLDFSSSGQGTRSQRAARLVAHLCEQSQDPDRAILDLLNFLYVDSPRAEFRKGSDEFAALERHVLKPRGVVLSDQGFALDALPAREASASTPGREHAIPAAEANPFAVQVPGVLPRNSASVFVVHGRDMRPVGVLRQFLIYLGLRMMSWPEAREQTGVPQPTTYEIVQAGMRSAAAIVVVFSPDDEARLKPEFWDNGYREVPEGQPRQNVLLEAGMAFASAPERTIFVRSASTRSISDISGFNWVKLDGSWDSREDFVKRLQAAGVRFSPPPNLMDELAGSFKVQ